MVSQWGRASTDVQALLNDGTPGARLDAYDQVSDGRDPHRRDASVSRLYFKVPVSVSERRSRRRDGGLNCFNDTESPGLQPPQEPPHLSSTSDHFLSNAVMSALAPKSRHIDAQRRRSLLQGRAFRQHTQDMLTLEVFQPCSMHGGNEHA